MTPEADIAYATRTLQNMLDADEIGTMTVDNQDRVREMLATLRAAGAAVADLRADRPRRAKKWDGFRVAITGRMQVASIPKRTSPQTPPQKSCTLCTARSRPVAPEQPPSQGTRDDAPHGPAHGLDQPFADLAPDRRSNPLGCLASRPSNDLHCPRPDAAGFPLSLHRQSPP